MTGPSMPVLSSTLTCPVCGFAKLETMASDACVHYHECLRREAPSRRRLLGGPSARVEAHLPRSEPRDQQGRCA